MVDDSGLGRLGLVLPAFVSRKNRTRTIARAYEHTRFVASMLEAEVAAQRAWFLDSGPEQLDARMLQLFASLSSEIEELVAYIAVPEPTERRAKVVQCLLGMHESVCYLGAWAGAPAPVMILPEMWNARWQQEAIHSNLREPARNHA